MAEVDAADAKRLKKAAKRAAAATAAAAEEAAIEEPKRKRKATAEAEVEQEVTAEVDAAEAKRVRKAAKRASAVAAAAVEAHAEPEVSEEVDAVEAKRLRKAAKRAAAQAAEAEATDDVDPAEAKRQRKAAKRAAAEALAEADDGAEAEELPKKKIKEANGDAEEAKKTNGGDADVNPFRAFVGGIAWSVDEDALRKDFSECGEVVDIKLLMDKETGKSRGIAFITFSDEAGFNAALKFDGEDYAGRKVNVSKANSDGGKGKGKDGKGKGKGKDGKGKGKSKGPGPKPDGCTSVVVKGLSYEVTTDDLQKTFEKCGSGPTNVKLLTDRDTGNSRGIAFVDFDNEKAVDEAMKLTETELKGRSFFMDYSQPREW